MIFESLLIIWYLKVTVILQNILYSFFKIVDHANLHTNPILNYFISAFFHSISLISTFLNYSFNILCFPSQKVLGSIKKKKKLFISTVFFRIEVNCFQKLLLFRFKNKYFLQFNNKCAFIVTKDYLSFLYPKIKINVILQCRCV